MKTENWGVVVVGFGNAAQAAAVAAHNAGANVVVLEKRQAN
jgi:succinate dehydrogenase/fumarate reductase flavoprotein subunit